MSKNYKQNEKECKPKIWCICTSCAHTCLMQELKPLLEICNGVSTTTLICPQCGGCGFGMTPHQIQEVKT